MIKTRLNQIKSGTAIFEYSATLLPIVYLPCLGLATDITQHHSGTEAITPAFAVDNYCYFVAFKSPIS